MKLREIIDCLPASSTVQYGRRQVEIEYYRRFGGDNLDQEVVFDWQGRVMRFHRVIVDPDEPENPYNNLIEAHPYLYITTTLPPFDPTVRGEDQ